MHLELPVYIIVFMFGITVGSFLNVCIYRIPKGESIVVVRSHCMNCDYQLCWYDLIPVVSYLSLGGRCRRCRTRISIQYPLVEVLNGVLYLIVFVCKGMSIESLLYCLLSSALLVLSVIDFRTFEIPIGVNAFILFLGVIRLITDPTGWLGYVMGFFSVSVFLYLIYMISGGRAIGGGDVKLMAVCGLVIGWKLVILGFLVGCILGSVIHVIRMRVQGSDRVLAMGPYLAMGVWMAALWGEEWIRLYLLQLGL